MDISPGVRAALDEVWQLGREDGNEHMIVLRNDKEVFRLDGDSEHVDMRDAIPHIEDGDVFVHNHPSSLNSLSNGDLLFAGAYHGTVYTITTDKSVYRGKFTEPRPPYFIAAMTMDLAFAQVMLRAGPVNSQSNSAQHAACLKLANEGWIDYEFELQEPTKRLIEQERS